MLDAGQHRAYVSQVYRDLLRRDPDSAGLEQWASSLDQGRSRTSVMLAIINSIECRTKQVQELYHSFLGPAAGSADQATFDQYVRVLSQGGTMEQVKASLCASAEYSRKNGSSDSDFLTALYRDAFNRSLDDSGRMTFTQALAAGITRRQVAELVFTSDEYRLNLVESMYQEFHHRGTDGSGRNYFSRALREGATDQQIITGILESMEYGQNASRSNHLRNQVLPESLMTSVALTADIDGRRIPRTLTIQHG